ncbi:MAG: restriction endonuclease [Candidatus Heimdallarchaeota archaeon]|nr:restriction endonuclease [Candidatus Heimdallarchaeota archaeon]
MPSNNVEEETALHELAFAFFKNMNFEIAKEVILVGSSGRKYQIDMIIKGDTKLAINEVLVKIVNWNRAVGVDRLIRFERMLTDLNNKKGMIISNMFSESAEKFAKRRGLIIYEKEHLQIIGE